MLTVEQSPTPLETKPAPKNSRGIVKAVALTAISGLVAYGAVDLLVLRPQAEHRKKVATQVASTYTALEIGFHVNNQDALPFIIHANGLNNEWATPKDPKYKQYRFMVDRPGQTDAALIDVIKQQVNVEDFNVTGAHSTVPSQAPKSVICDASSDRITTTGEWQAELNRLNQGVPLNQGCINTLEHAGVFKP